MPKTRKHGDGALYWSESKRLWIGRVDDGFHPDGRRKQREVSSADKKEAERKLRRLQVQIEAGEVRDSTVTFSQWVDQWWKNGPGLSPHATRDYQSALKVHILPVLGRKRLNAIQPADIQAVYNRMHEHGLARSSVVKIHRIMGSIWSDAVRNEKVKRDVVALTKLRNMGTQQASLQPKALNAEQAIAVLDVAKERDDYTRWLVGFVYGARPGELFGALIEDLEPDCSGLSLGWSVTEANFEHGCMRPGEEEPNCGRAKRGRCPQRRRVGLKGVDHRVLDGRFILKRPKNGNVRFLHLVDPVDAALRQHLARLRGAENPHGLLWPGPKGWPRFHKADSEAWRDILMKANVLTAAQIADPELRPRPYATRHTAVTLMRRLGIPDTTIGAIVGHSASRVTDMYDDQRDRAGGEAAARKLSESLSR